MTHPCEGSRVGVIADSLKPAHLSPLVPDLVRALEELGHEVAVMDPDATPTSLHELAVRADLYVLKGGSEAALSIAGALERLGALVVNPYAVAAACRDKIVQTTVLAAAGVPVPESWLTTDPRELADELRVGPLIVKDPRGSRGRGLHVVHAPDQLDPLERGRPWLAMRYHQPDGHDLKLYRIGDDVFGVHRPFPARTLEEKQGTPAHVDDTTREIVLRCGDAFGIEVYGVDIIHSQGRAWVVDMSSFPGFKGVPNAGSLIATHVSRRLSAASAPGFVTASAGVPT